MKNRIYVGMLVKKEAKLLNFECFLLNKYSEL